MNIFMPPTDARFVQWRSRWRWFSLFHVRRPRMVSLRSGQEVKDLCEWLTRTLVTGREKSSWRSYGRRWNCIPDVEVLVVGGVEIVDLELLLITLAATPNAGSEAFEELDSAAGRRRLQLANRLFRFRHHGLCLSFRALLVWGDTVATRSFE